MRQPYPEVGFRVGQLRLPPPHIISSPHKVDQWLVSLTPGERGRFLLYLQQLLKQQPKTVQKKIFNIATQLNSTAVGVGVVGAAVSWGTVIGKMAGSLVSSAASVGTSLYNGKQQADLQRELAGQSANLDLQMQFIQTQAQKEISKAQQEAETKAAEIAGRSQIESAKQMAQATTEKAKIEAMRDIAQTEITSKSTAPAKTTLAAGGVLAALVAGGYFLVKK